MATRLGWLGLVLAVSLLATGCGAYVNIPQDPGDIASNDPNVGAVRNVAAAALLAVAQDKTLGQPYAIRLPADTGDAHYTDVLKELGPDASRWTQSTPATTPLLEVRQVRIRSWLAQADVIRPNDPRRPDGLQELVTVDLEFGFGRGWKVVNLHTWSVPLEEALFQARYQEINAQPLPQPGPPQTTLPPEPPPAPVAH